MEMDTDMDILALKDAFWKLTARVALVENFITKEFGTSALRVIRRKYSITAKTAENKSKSRGHKTDIDSGNVGSCIRNTSKIHTQTHSKSEDKDHSESPNIDPRSKKQMPFVLLLEKYPELLKKSQKPSFLKVKNKAIKEFTYEVRSKLGLQFTKKSLFKKISNMKNTTKKKSNSNPTVKKETCGLSEWERRFLQLLNDVKNNLLLPKRSVTMK